MSQTVVINKTGSYGYNRQSGSSMPYEFQATITGFSANYTIPLTNLLSVQGTAVNGVARASGNPAVEWVSCTSPTNVVFRKNNSSGAIISGMAITEATIQSLRDEGVTAIYAAVACSNRNSGWGAGNYGGDCSTEGTRPSARVVITTLDVRPVNYNTDYCTDVKYGRNVIEHLIYNGVTVY